MDKTVKIRDAIRSFCFDNSRWLKIIGKGLVSLCSFLIINHFFGYIIFLKNPIFAIIMALSCAFMPLRAGGLFVMAYIFIQLTGLSGQVAFIALILMVMSYGLSIFYGARHMFNISYLPVFVQVQMPYPIPVISALLGRMSDVAAVISGGILSFYLKTIRENASLFIDENSDITVVDVISQKMLANPMLYIFIASIVAMFVVIMLLKNSQMKRAWLVAIASGIFVEMAFMLTGYVVTGNIGKVPWLIVSNAIAFLVGFAITYIFRDLDYERIERVQFEDDDYVYYVTAIPKIELQKEQKRVTRITDARSRFYDAGRIEDETQDVTDETQDVTDETEEDLTENEE